MDEVPIATTNPVNLIIRKQEEAPKLSRKDSIKESLKNFFIMLPFALVVIAQFFFLGNSFGEFSTFPVTSFTTYIFIGSILLMLLFSQMLMRSIVYSTLAGAALVAGVLYAWFGDFYTPLAENFRGISDILKAAWTRKDVPFNLLVTGAMTALIVGVSFAQFFASLLVKSFFELLFGKEWGDGRLVAFAGTIALLAGIQIGFYSYTSVSSQTKEKLLWERAAKYSPVEKFITRTPGSTIIGKDRIWVSLENKNVVIDAKTGKERAKASFQPASVHKGFLHCETPVFASSDRLYAFDPDMNTNLWKTPYPASFPGLELDDDKLELFNKIPLTTRFIDSGKKLLVFYDYGYVGAYKVSDGSMLWLKQVDLQIRANRVFPDLYLENGHFLEIADRLIFGCHNGLVRCLKAENGEQLWQYQHGTPKIGGKSQKGFLSSLETRVVVSFKSGELITLASEDGRKVYQAVNPLFSPAAPPACQGLKASFLTEEGIFYQIELDGGALVYKTNTLPHRLDLVPVIQSLSDGIVAHRDEVLQVDTQAQTVNKVFKNKNRVFVTKPVIVDKIMYIGTQDGWIHCLHIGSKHEKWRVHVNGELEEDSLTLMEESLLVKTRSGSLYCFNRSY
ncbi:MAG: hypothetical protein EOM80_00080 [Erysipelotrichia bacterium]|nr:hypothetical protein [Erysipelotrichia bacterium]